MRTYQTKLIRIKHIAGMLYVSNVPRNTLVIYGIGAPLMPDSGNLPDARTIMNFDADLFVPDYIGYGRSDGIFTPKNCIKTFLYLYEWITEGCNGINHYENNKIKLWYKRIVFIGRSFGGTYIPLLPRFNSSIQELGIIYPAVDNKSCGSIPGEESNDDFMRSMRFDGYKYLYRGILSKVWERHLECEDDLSPMDNIRYLENVRLFIGHGKKDTCIHYSKSVVYHKKILEKYPGRKNQFVLKLYPKSGHTPETSTRAANDFLTWLGIKRLNGE